jgi:hypothetical protein
MTEPTTSSGLGKRKPKGAVNKTKRRRDNADDLNGGEIETVPGGERNIVPIVARPGGARETVQNALSHLVQNTTNQAQQSLMNQMVQVGANEGLQNLALGVVQNVGSIFAENMTNQILQNLPRDLGFDTLRHLNVAVISRNSPDLFAHVSRNGSIDSFIRMSDHIRELQAAQEEARRQAQEEARRQAQEVARQHAQHLADLQTRHNAEMEAMRETVRVANQQAERVDLFKKSGLDAIDPNW